MLRVVQLSHPCEGRRIAVVEVPHLRLATEFATVHDAALAAIRAGQTLDVLLSADTAGEALKFDAVYDGRSPWTCSRASTTRWNRRAAMSPARA